MRRSAGARRTGPWRVAWALIGLRWRMVRSRRTRIGLLSALALALLALGLARPIAHQLPHYGDPGAAIALALAVFLIVATIAPLAAGGGYQLFPPEQLAVHPVPSRAIVRISLLLTPLNLAWYAQTIALTALALTMRLPISGTAALLFLIACWVLASTVFGQAIAWWIAGVRRNQRGRAISWVALAAGLAVGYPNHRNIAALVVRGPGRFFNGLPASGPALTFAVGLALLGLSSTALRAADRACAWTLSRRSVEAPEGQRAIKRRADPVSPYRARIAADRASIWRSPPLKRGLLVLGLLPAVSAAVARLDWPSLALLPGFVATGTALLFGVNAFCLEGGGAIWLLSNPQEHRTALHSKAAVILETMLLAVVVAMSGGLLRARYAPDALGIAAVAASVLVATSVVLANCLRLTVTKPHRADLLGPRDTPAPPGSMAVYAARLTLAAAFPAAAFSIFARLELGWPILALATVLLIWAGASIVGTVRRWDDPQVRADVAVTVSAG